MTLSEAPNWFVRKVREKLHGKNCEAYKVARDCRLITITSGTECVSNSEHIEWH